GAMGVWRGEGIRVPDHVRVVSFDDLEAGALSDPPLTSVTNPAERMGWEATRMLRERLAGGGVEEPVLLPAKLVARVSG
ncbi:MAG: substrate-binding domain-containing protein, partial [Actinomyces sp.]|nr:substrate-binding domain-containing protein [Actinomyces sp.]